MPKPPSSRQLTSVQLIERQQSKMNNEARLCSGAIVIVNVRTPENLGAIYRLADAAGLDSVVVINEEGENCFSDKKLKRISRNAMSRLNIKYCTEVEFIKSHADYQPLVAIEICTDSDDIFSRHLPEKCSFVVGNEREGIAQAILDVCARAIHIPMFGMSGSMNVSHALAICLFEWRRQCEYDN